NTEQATADAVYPAADDHLYYTLDKEEGLEPHRPVAMLLSGTSEPNYHVDIEAVFRTQIRAVLSPASQIHGRTEAQMVREYDQRARAARDASQEGPAMRES